MVQEATEAVKAVMMNLDLAKMANKDELKKGEETIPPCRQPEPAGSLMTRPKSSRGQRVKNPLKPKLLQPKQHSMEPGRQETRCRNERTCLACRFSSSMQSPH